MEKRILLPWDDIRYFLAVARAGSANAAARELGLHHTTIGRRLKALEGRLGTRLLEQRDGHLELTKAGVQALTQAEQMEALAQALVRQVGDSDSRAVGDVRVGVTEGLSAYWLTPRLRPFQHAHPELRIELVVANAIQDLLTDVDVAIRFSPPTEPSLIARRVAVIRFSLFATVAYEQTFGLPRSLAELPRHRFIDAVSYHRNTALEPWTVMLRELPVAMRTDNAATLQAALDAGTGIGLAPAYEHLVNPSVIRVPVDLGLSTGVWLVYAEERRHVARIRAVASEIARLFEADRNTWFC